MNDRERLMRKIQISDFLLLEAGLYLDSHKNDKDALAYFNKHNLLAKELKEEYTKKYGPLVMTDSNSESVWEWADGPWSWEYASDSNSKI